MSTYTSQIQILHFSDLHFGEHHICNPMPSASKSGIPSLGELITEDLQNDFGATVTDKTDYSNQQESPLIIAVSGDFTQKALHEEFDEANKFLNKLTSVELLKRSVPKKNVFITPGNHDFSRTAASTISFMKIFGHRNLPINQMT
jgi:3',5'-cyclic AMP phosphodiesterase CpdA